MREKRLGNFLKPFFLNFLLNKPVPYLPYLMKNQRIIPYVHSYLILLNVFFAYNKELFALRRTQKRKS